MTHTNESCKVLALQRMDVVSRYWEHGGAPTVFARMYNAGTIDPCLFVRTGPIEPDDLDYWSDICMGLARDRGSDTALAEAQEQYIRNLETNLREKIKTITELTEKLQKKER